ncbi:MAG TPA: HET-C-related protein [Chitinophagaceae bacterium]|nr:HET-C-related protein [Chitinophagaceae bacterium]
MEAKGHEEIARDAGIPLLKEAFKRAGKEFLPAHAQAFYMGNWLRDLSQVIDPAATADFAVKADKAIKDYYNWLIARMVPLKLNTGIAEINNAIEEDKANLLLFVKRVVKTRNQGRDSDLHRMLRFLIKFKAYNKFCKPDKENKTKIPFEIFKKLFDEFYTQYFPHEHLDRPETGREEKKTLYSDHTDKLTRDPDNKDDNYLNVYSYLKDDLFVVAGILAEVDRDWASRFFKSGVAVDEYETYRNLAQIGRALHGIEDFFAHSNFIEHACTLMSSKFMKENQIWTNTVLNKRLKKYKPINNDPDNFKMNTNWVDLPNEPNVSTGYFDVTDTFISLGHLLEEVLFGDQNETAIVEFLKKLKDFVGEPLAFVKSKIDPGLMDQPELTRFTELQPDTIFWLTSEFGKTDFILRNTEFKSGLETFLRLMSNPYVVQSIRTYATGYEYLEDLKELYQMPVSFIIRKQAKWILKKVSFFTADAIVTAHANFRIGSHSLMAKDGSEAFLYSHSLNCAKAAHWYIVNTLCRWSYDTGEGGKKEDAKWVNWAQLCEFFLGHPFSKLRIEKETREFVIDNLHYVRASNQPMYDTLISLAEKYKSTAQFAETDNHKYWEEIAEVNFDLNNKLKEMGITGSIEQLRKHKKRILNNYMRIDKIGQLVQFGPGASPEKAVALIIPLQRTKTEMPVYQANADKWFIRIMEPSKPKSGKDGRWNLFASEQNLQGKFLDSRYHKYRYYKSQGKNDDTPAKKLDNMIKKARSLRDQLQSEYPRKQQARPGAAAN